MPGERCCLEQVETSAGNGPGRGEAVGGSLGQVQGETGAKCQGCSKAACRRGPRKEQESTAGSPYPLPPWDRGRGARACCRGPCRKVESGRAWSFQVELGQSKTGRWWEPAAGWCPAWGGARERRTPSPAGVLASTPCPVPSPSAGQRDLCLCRQRDALRPGLAEHLGRDPELPGAGQAAAAPALAAAGAVGAGPGGGREPTLPWAAVGTG